MSKLKDLWESTRRRKLKHKVTEIKIQVHRKDRRTIILDNGNVFGISEDVLLSAPISVGDELSAEDIEQFRSLDKLQSLRGAALRLLSFRMRSKAELTERLIRKGYSKEEVLAVICEFEEKKYLNDREFGLAFARDKIRNKKIGPVALRSELVPHRLKQDLVEYIISTVYNEYPVDELISDLLKKRNVSINSELDKRNKTKLINYLKRKGFEWPDISRALQT